MKSVDKHLVTTKIMITSYYKTKVLQKNNPSKSMIFILSGDKFKRKEEGPRIKCDFCIKWFMNYLEKRFKITRDGVLSKHLGVHYP